MIKELTGKHVLIMLITFFGVVFSMSGLLIYQAETSWTGLETFDAFRKGIKYNQQLSESERQNHRGWSMNIKHEKRASGGLSLRAVPRDRGGETLSGLRITALMKRPTHEGIDQSIQLKETGLGVYTGQFDKLQLGKWYLYITARRGTRVMFRSKNRFIMK